MFFPFGIVGLLFFFLCPSLHMPREPGLWDKHWLGLPFCNPIRYWPHVPFRRFATRHSINVWTGPPKVCLCFGSLPFFFSTHERANIQLSSPVWENPFSVPARVTCIRHIVPSSSLAWKIVFDRVKKETPPTATFILNAWTLTGQMRMGLPVRLCILGELTWNFFFWLLGITHSGLIRSIKACFNLLIFLPHWVIGPPGASWLTLGVFDFFAFPSHDAFFIAELLFHSSSRLTLRQLEHFLFFQSLHINFLYSNSLIQGPSFCLAVRFVCFGFLWWFFFFFFGFGWGVFFGGCFLWWI